VKRRDTVQQQRGKGKISEREREREREREGGRKSGDHQIGFLKLA